MNEEIDAMLREQKWNRPPWVVVDPDYRREWLMAEPPRYYLVNLDGDWFVCDSWADSEIEGTKSKSRADAIRLFFESTERHMPEHEPEPETLIPTKEEIAYRGETG